MKNMIAIHTHQQWVQTLATGCQTDGLFRLSPALAQRLISVELIELRRDLVHCHRRQKELAHEATHQTREGRETLDQGIIRRRLQRQREQEGGLRGEIALLVRAIRSLVEQGRFLPPNRPPVVVARSRSTEDRDWSLRAA